MWCLRFSEDHKCDAIGCNSMYLEGEKGLSNEKLEEIVCVHACVGACVHVREIIACKYIYMVAKYSLMS